MPPPRKFFLNNTVVFVTFRTEEGLPFVPVRFINELIWSAIAKGQALYPVKICAMNFEANHAHLVLYVENPELVSPFIGYIKQETAHALNRLLGRRKHTIWAEGYDSPTVLDHHQALEQIAYTLLNPVKDNLVATIDDYPGVSTYKLFKHDQTERECIAIARDRVPCLKNPHCPWKEDLSISERLKIENPTKLPCKLSPYIWKLAFPETKNLPDEEVRKLILAKLQKEEARYREENQRKRLPNLNPQELTKQSVLKHYLPSKFAPRSVCLSVDKIVRKTFRSFVKYLSQRARDVWALWKKGDYTAPFPPGLFAPCLPRRTNLIPSVVWT